MKHRFTQALRDLSFNVYQWIDKRNSRKRIYRFIMRSVAFFLLSWYLDVLVQIGRKAWQTHEYGWQVLELILLQLVMALSTTLVNLFDPDDRRDPPDDDPVAPWPQAPGEGERPVLMFECDLGERVAK